MTKNKKTFVVGITCVMITATLLIAGLWPFNFIPANKVEWLQNGNGIQFYGQGIVFSQEPLVIQEANSQHAAFSIELFIRPHGENRRMMSSILVLYNGEGEQMLIGQWKKELFIRVPRTPAVNLNNQKRYREIGIENALEGDTTHLIAVTSEKRNTNVYIDGRLAKRFSNFSLIPYEQKLSGTLILGNSSNGMHTWNGTFFGLAIYNHILDIKEVFEHYSSWGGNRETTLLEENKPMVLYLFDEHGGEQIQDHSGSRNNLRLPANFYPLRRTILALPQKAYWFSSSNLTDIIINILGFMPFGVFFSAWFRQAKNYSVQRSCCITILLGFCISLGIELAQVYLPTRDSSLVDVISNTIGTAVGALLLKYALPVLHRIKGDRALN